MHHIFICLFKISSLCIFTFFNLFLYLFNFFVAINHDFSKLRRSSNFLFVWRIKSCSCDDLSWLGHSMKRYVEYPCTCCATGSSINFSNSQPCYSTTDFICLFKILFINIFALFIIFRTVTKFHTKNSFCNY